MISADKALERWIVEHRVGWLDWLSIGLSRIGTLGLVWIAIALVLAAMRRRPAILAVALAADAAADLLATLGKTVIHRHRPFVHQLGPATSTHSFPSGHAATSFACATVIGAYVPRLRAPLYVLAALIALSRLYNGDHFPLDVLAGACLGLLVGFGLLQLVLRVPLRPSAGRRGRRREPPRG